jgi:hypothetical protein
MPALIAGVFEMSQRGAALDRAGGVKLDGEGLAPER